MARARLQRGEASAVTYRGMVDGKWTMASKIPAGTKPSKWRATVRYQDGKAVRPKEVTAEDTSKARAEKKVQARLAALMRQGRSTADANVTMRQAVEEYRRKLEAGELEKAPATVRTYRSVISHDVLRTGSGVADMRLVDIRVADLKTELKALLASGSGSHLKHVRAIWGYVLSEAVEDELIDANPAVQLKLPEKRIKEGRELKPFSALEAADLWEKVREDSEARRLGLDDLVLLGLTQGLRIGEAVSLRWEDVDVDSAVPTISVRGKLVRVKGEGLVWDEVTKSILGRRTMAIRDQEVTLMLRRRMSERDQAQDSSPEIREVRNTYVFTSETGRLADVDNINKKIRALFDRCGYPWATFHTLRRTVSADLKRAGIPYSEVSRFLGHSERVNRDRYADISEGVALAAITAPVSALGAVQR